MLSALYAAVVRRRRERYAARPDLRKRLLHPVISVGNLALGGRGKTPLVASLARMLRDAGERPAVLTRGYGRARRSGAVVVVRDPEAVRAGLDEAGDEPLMLARQLPGVSVLVCADRYRAGRHAEERLGATVHILDDGFQHLQLERDIDLLILSREDIARPITLPWGRLREPLDTIIAADAILTGDDEVVVQTGDLDLPVFRLRRTGDFTAPSAEPVIAVAGIAGPGRFFDDLRAGGWQVVDRLEFADHHRYTPRDVSRIVHRARRCGAVRIVTTEKDYVRLTPLQPIALPVTWLGIVVEPEPLAPFREWIMSGLATTRGQAHG